MVKRFFVAGMFLFATFAGAMTPICHQLFDSLRRAERELDYAYDHNDTESIIYWSYRANGIAIGLGQEGCL